MRLSEEEARIMLHNDYDEKRLIQLIRVWDETIECLHKACVRFANHPELNMSDEYKKGWSQCADYIRLGDYVIKNNPEDYGGLDGDSFGS